MSEFKVPDLIPKHDPGQDNQITEATVVQQHQTINCPYKEPKWSKKPNQDIIYKFEVLKSGAIVEEIENLQSKSYWLIGRLEGQNDIVMAHPTISRFHAVLQYKSKQSDAEESKQTNNDEIKFEEGWYIYDLGSTHGTFLNKQKIPSKVYFRVKVGHMIRFGGSTRNFILQGPEFDEEPESELSVTEMKELRVQKEQEILKNQKLIKPNEDEDGIDWGMGEDAEEETDLSVNPYSLTNNEELFLDDPKKTLRGFFEREGLDLEYKVDEMSTGTFICRIELPVDDMNGKPIIAEICHKGKKKECVVQCALEACRILDRHGVLRQSHHEPLKKKKHKSDSDDDDDFLDRTGDVEKKRLKKASASNQSVALTYDDLKKQEVDILAKIADVEKNILRNQEILKRSKELANNEDDDLDNFMKNLSDNSTIDKTEVRKLKVELQQLQMEHQKIQKLIKIAEPVQFPMLSGTTSNNSSVQNLENKKKIVFPLFGKRNKFKMNIVRSETSSAKPKEKEMKSDEEEFEEDDDVDNDNKSQTKKEMSTKEDKSQSKLVKSEQDQEESGQKIEKNEEHQKQEIEQQEEKESEQKQKEESKCTSVRTKKQIGPAFIPSIELLKSVQEKPYEKLSEQSNSTENVTDVEESSNAIQERKRKSRNRSNRLRQNVDIDDAVEFEDEQKYSGWIPPENQTGDGITSLNKKFGY